MAPQQGSDETTIMAQQQDEEEAAAIQVPQQQQQQHHENNNNENGSSLSERPTNEYVLNVAFYSFIGFVVFQAVFAIIAHSESMLADSEAMSVDALTYLFNLVAERIKNLPYSDKELALPPERRQYQRELRRLYLELVPPAISVTTLMAVTVVTTTDALATLRAVEDAAAGEDDVSVPIMLLFSAANLLLDIVNVTCFARADSTFGLDIVRRENATITETIRVRSLSDVGLVVDEFSPLLQQCPSSESELTELATQVANTDGENGNISPRRRRRRSSKAGLISDDQLELVNLNMCSAWTHVCADTLRSVAVLVAAFLATVVPSIQGATADSIAAIVVSIIIFVSLFPLLQGLVLTGLQLHELHRNPPLC